MGKKPSAPVSRELETFRYHRSPTQVPYELKDSYVWGTFVRYIELGDDSFVSRQVDEYANGYLSRYDRTHWDDQFGTLANLRFGKAWMRHWGKPIAITRDEFEHKWQDAVNSPINKLKSPSPFGKPPWL